MKITPFEIYLITRLDVVFNLAMVLASLSGATFILILIGWLIDDNICFDAKKRRQTLKRAVPVFIVSVLVACFCPTTKQAAAMYAIPAIVNSKVIQHDVPKALEELCKKVIGEEKGGKK